jgi:cytochrome b6-f complex iron-sulfur subunit
MVGGVAALSALMPCLNACVSEEEKAPQSSGSNNSGSNQGNGGPLATIDLTDPATASQISQRRYVYAGDIIVAQTLTGRFIAVSKVCPHRGTTIIYQPEEQRFFCPNHFSLFGHEGQLLRGPSAQPLVEYRTELDEQQQLVRVFQA